MSSTLFRFGLWIILAVLALYVLRETFTESPNSELMNLQLLGRAAILGALLLAAGVVSSLFERAASKVTRRHCQLCSRPTLSGEMFCREHLRNILEEEHDRTHQTSIRRRS